jgi:Glycosyl transferases group 1
VITTMGRGLFSPVLLRPFFNCLGLVTCRTFETPAANTIPLFDVTEESVREIYGDAAVELVLPEDPTSKIADVLLRPEHYSAIVTGIRQRLRDQHSYASRIGELIEIVTS